uniref:Uncharacterized protein n=1 Tax=Tanacetum cinerariifolium TaxID=118510 RepID=A0A6L2J1J0_TANCI|nr:hypothetical protein [Tanacetum cinerariifolium]
MLRKKNAEIEAKRIAEEENAAKDKEEEEETEYNVDNIEKDVEDEEAKSADEEANLVEEHASEQVNNEEDVEENDDVNQIFHKIQTMPFLNTVTRSNKNQVGKVEEESEEEEHDDEIGIEAEKENEEEMVKNTKKGQKCINLKEPSTSKKKTMNKSEEEEENYSNSEDEEELKKVKKVKWKKEVKKPSKQVKHPTCNTRSSLKPLFDAMSGLSEERKRCLKQMGFERYIQFPIVKLPSKLAYHVIENFHCPSMELRLQKGSIKATRQKVNDILGIPMGNTKLQDLDKRLDNDPFIAKWEAQYNHLGKPTPRAIALQMSGTTTADFMFKINFLTLFGSTMGTLENGGRVPKSKHNWEKAKTSNNYYYGPLTFLCTSNKKLKHSDDEKKNHDGNKNKKEKQAKNEEKQDDIEKGTKEARSETKNDKDEVHAKVDDLNERMKDKEVDKQNVNDGNENEKDKQDEHHHLTQNEFLNEEYDLTESHCEELEYQATQKIKKNKTPKRKKPEDMTPPTFSLGLTPDESEHTQKEKEKQAEKRAKGLSPLESEPKLFLKYHI